MSSNGIESGPVDGMVRVIRGQFELKLKNGKVDENSILLRTGQS